MKKLLALLLATVLLLSLTACGGGGGEATPEETDPLPTKEPVTFLDRTGITQIRPLLYCGENLIRHTAERLALPVVENPCPADGNTKRQEIKELVYELQGRYPGLKGRAFGAMQRLPLPEWGPVEHRRRPLPEELGED